MMQYEKGSFMLSLIPQVIAALKLVVCSSDAAT